MNAQGGCVYGRQSDPYKKGLLESDYEEKADDSSAKGASTMAKTGAS
jgi:hypothetical protein